MDLTVCFITNRIDPKFDWFFDSLSLQGFNGQVIVIDFHAEDQGRLDQLLAFQTSFSSIVHTTPKPCVWQGKYKLTRTTFFAAANARNTGFALCKTPYVAFVDDLTVLMPGWLDQVLHACQNNYVMCGAYAKAYEMVVEKGVLVSCRRHSAGEDSRRQFGSHEGIRRVQGSCLYGCSFAMPLDAAFQVNGFDERHDSIGGEDSDFGTRLERVGVPIYYNLNALSIESEELHGDFNFKERQVRLSKKIREGYYSCNLMLDQLRSDRHRSWTIGNPFNLRELNAIAPNFPIPKEPTHHWVDGQPLAEM